VRGYGGLGLGLAISRCIVEQHDGSIGVHSSGEEDAGSTFYFTLPVAVRSVTPPLKSGAVLLLSDQSAPEEHLSLALIQQGFMVETVNISDTPDWLEQVLERRPVAVVLDYEPAAARSLEIMEVLKKHPETQEIPVVFYALQTPNSGAVLELDYLSKPIGSTELAQMLKRQGWDTAEEPPRTILVVDDEPGLLRLHVQVVQRYLPKSHVRSAANGREALAAMSAERPDLVLLDLMMPEVNGFQVLETMRDLPTLQNVPVVILTAQTLTEAMMERLNHSVAAILQKGVFTTEETMAQVQQALLRHKQLNNDAQRVVRKAMAYLHEHYTEPITREKLARHVGLSERYLTQCFHRETGIAPITYLNRYRVQKAKGLLDAGEKNITEVALEVGFSDSNYFGQAFRRVTGMSPSAYQRQLRPSGA